MTPKMADRWKEIHWLCISTRCWKCTYGPDTKAWTHVHESKDADGTSWPEWTGLLQSYEHHSNRTREEARERLGRSITVPDYAQLVNAMAGERISIATEMVMAHLSIHIRMGHALQKKERLAVGKHSSLRDDIAGS